MKVASKSEQRESYFADFYGTQSGLCFVNFCVSPEISSALSPLLPTARGSPDGPAPILALSSFSALLSISVWTKGDMIRNILLLILALKVAKAGGKNCPFLAFLAFKGHTPPDDTIKPLRYKVKTLTIQLIKKLYS